jgi:alpha-tubulin suppressor-like RCC1 family protein
LIYILYIWVNQLFMKIKLLLFASILSLNSYSQGCVDRIVTSDDMMTVFLLDGTSLTWGKNQYGQLGNNTAVQQNMPAYTINGSQWLDVNHARMHTVALKQDKTIWAWGNNAVGQLGNGSLTDSYVPVQVGADADWVAISPGNLHTIALKTNGTLWGWGNNGGNELASGFPTYYVNPVQLGTDTDWSKVYGGYFKTLAIKANGTLWGRSRNDYGDLGIGNASALLALVQIGTDTNWAKISCARNSFTFGLKTDGKLWAWGDNENGRLGDGTTTNRNMPVQIGADNWIDIAAGNYHAVGIKADGTMWQWGSYGGPVNGVVLIPESHVPVQVGTDNHWKTVVAGYFTCYAIKDDNTLWTWGHNGGYLGDGTTISRPNPVQIPCNQLGQIHYNPDTLALYPNPVKNMLNLSGIDNLNSFEVVDMLGQIVLRGSVTNNSIDLSGLSDGIYVGVFHTADGQVLKNKFSKE